LQIPGVKVVGENRSISVIVALIGAVATILGALIASGRWDPPFLNRDQDNPAQSPDITLPSVQPPDVTLPSIQLPLSERGEVSTFLNRDSGPAGTAVMVSGQGFSANERITIRFHTEQVGSTTANDQGAFTNVAVTIPESFSKFAPRQFDIVATGERSARSAEAPFTISG
jgi:hypothetical protein